MKIRNKKIVTVICCLLSVILIFSPLTAKKAEAQWIVFDPTNFAVNSVTAVQTTSETIKDYGLDSIAWLIINIIIERIAADTVNWINTGFQGGPAFVTNPGQFFGQLSNGIAGSLIYSNPNWQFMCAPFRDKVQIAINQAYNQPFGNFQCTLTGVIGNFDNFIGDFNQGGWEGFIELTQNSQNNPIGLYNQWQNQVNVGIASEQYQKQQELVQNNGFLTLQKCGSADPTAYNNCRLNGYSPLTCQYSYQTCTNETPGSVIETQLNNVLNTGNNRLQVADEINEIISALLNQLVNKAIGGLRSLSSGDTGNNNQVYTNQLENASFTDKNIQQASSTANAAINAGDSTLTNIGNVGPSGSLCIPSSTDPNNVSCATAP